MSYAYARKQGRSAVLRPAPTTMRNAFWPAAALLIAVLALAAGGGATRQNAAANDVVVTTAADHDDGNCTPLDCTLREAINAAHAGDTIKFNIPGAGPHVIEPTGSELPAVIPKN